MLPMIRSWLDTSPVRFVLAGALNTAISLAVYLALLVFLPPAIAYSVTFVIGICTSYILNRTFVFRVSGGGATILLFPMVYVAQYSVGLVVVVAWVDLLGLPASLATLAAVVITLPITYLASRWVFVTRRQESRPEAPDR